MSYSPPIVSFLAPSGTGKTTLIEKLITELVGRGLRIAAMTHTGKDFDIDHEGKDTHRFRGAGATRVGITNDRVLAIYGEVEPELTLRQMVDRYTFAVDLVLAEGFRSEDVPHIMVCRGGARQQPYDATREGVIAVFGDMELPGGRPRVALEDTAAQADFLITHFGVSAG